MGSSKRKGISRAATIEAWIVVAMVCATWWMLSSGTLERVIDTSTTFGPAAGLFAGLFYSLFITVPIAVGAFLALAGSAPAWQIALWGAFGSATVDFVLAKGVRSPLMTDILDAVFGTRTIESIEKKASRGPWRWVWALFGAFLLAIPLPTDEEGVALLGASNLKSWQLFFIMLIADFVGIYILVSAAELFF